MAEPGRMPNRSDDQRYRVEKNRLREERLASDMDRLDTMARLELHIEQLLHQAHRCEAALESAQMELASARAGGSRTSADSVIEALQGTIRRVKEVQAELDKLRH